MKNYYILLSALFSLCFMSCGVFKSKVNVKKVESQYVQNTSTADEAHTMMFADSIIALRVDTLEKGNKKEISVLIKNTLNEPVSVVLEKKLDYILPSSEFSALKPEEQIELTFTFDTNKCDIWGNISDYFCVVLEGEKQSLVFVINATACVVDKKTRLSEVEKKNQPAVNVLNNPLQLVIVGLNAEVQNCFLLKNNGKSPLEIRRVINNNEDLFIDDQSLTIQPGKTEKLDFVLATRDMKQGNNKRTIVLQTNDLKNMFIPLNIEYELND